MTKLWEKEAPVNKAEAKAVEKFTVGKDREFDMYLALYDAIASAAHARMLGASGIIPIEESEELVRALGRIQDEIRRGEFTIEDGVEDVHSQIELLLTRRMGETGKKIHTGRSRNDQSLTAIKLFLKEELKSVKSEMKTLFDLLLDLSGKHGDKLLPGYTHFQAAMPSSFGLWFGAYAESLADDLEFMQAAFSIADRNPLGSAAGYGSSFAIDREMTTKELGFSGMNINSVYAQMTRGKTEKAVAMALAMVASTLNKLASDMVLFMSTDMQFISFPDHLTTGSSIMPHKKNPDVWELVRSHSNRLMALPNTLSMMTNSLPSGYHRDMQLLKEELFPAFANLKECIRMSVLMLKNVSVRDHILEDEKYKYVFSVEEVNRLVKEGMSFREAYRAVALSISAGTFHPEGKVRHTHTGSVGSLGTEEVRKRWRETEIDN